ncbi:hypothetical protein FGO68_gene9169 [Halteria grandinella]|uniref:Uncharacterized protein n=1 Tax=Halteria grandinella TaxID=5974 RepID=A0A8J8N9W3_HALGN|nr:hypothetical protein FGO68_gene9169 [Halteria grandinella]
MDQLPNQMHGSQPRCNALHGELLCVQREDVQQLVFRMAKQMNEEILNQRCTYRSALPSKQLVTQEHVVAQKLENQQQECTDLHPHQIDHFEVAPIVHAYLLLSHRLREQRRLLSQPHQPLHTLQDVGHFLRYGSCRLEMLFHHRQSLCKCALNQPCAYLISRLHLWHPTIASAQLVDHPYAEKSL